MEAKVDKFVSNFSDWSKIIGFNWYHGGEITRPPKVRCRTK